MIQMISIAIILGWVVCYIWVCRSDIGDESVAVKLYESFLLLGSIIGAGAIGSLLIAGAYGVFSI